MTKHSPSCPARKPRAADQLTRQSVRCYGSKGARVHDQGQGSPTETRREGPGVRGRIMGVRDWIRRNKAFNSVYRVIIGVLGTAIIVGGFALIPLPGPGWLIVFAGLALLATEFAWAERLLDYARDKVRAWTEWVKRQSLTVRILLAVATFALVVAAVVGVDAWIGLPGWVPVLGD